jgi:DNA-directed RNA polymerase specialized sigma24 family protein
MPDTNPFSRAQVQALSDDALIALLPTPEDKRELMTEERAALDELWRRHAETIRTRLRMVIYSSRGPCPFFWFRDEFLQQSFSRSYIKFLAGIRRREYKNFAGYLCTLAYSAAIDEQRKITGRCVDVVESPPRPIPVGGAAPLESDAAPGSDEEVSGEEPALEAEDSSSSRSVLKVGQLDPKKPLYSKLPDPLHTLEHKERRNIVRELLERHAYSSPESALSTATLRMRFWQDYTWTDIADRIMRSVPLSLATRAKKVERFANKDCSKLKSLLGQEFKITDSEHL